MSELLLTAENEGLNLTDCLLPTATLGSWSVWGEEEASPANRLESTQRDRCEEECVNRRSMQANRVFNWAETTTATTAVCLLKSDDLKREDTPAGPSPPCFGCGSGRCCIIGSPAYHSSYVSSVQQHFVTVL